MRAEVAALSVKGGRGGWASAPLVRRVLRGMEREIGLGRREIEVGGRVSFAVVHV